MPITVTISAEPSGSVVAYGGDGLAHSLLSHARFAFANDRHGPRHRLPTSMPSPEQAAIASHAAEMLNAARYAVDLDPALNTARPSASAARVIGDHLLDLTDQIRGATSGAELSELLGQLLHPEHGALEHLREALEAAGEQITDLDDEAYTLADRFAVSAEFVGAAEGELIGVTRGLRQIGSPEPCHPQEPAPSRAMPASHEAALAKSPAAVQAGPSRSTPFTTPQTPSPSTSGWRSSPRAQR